MPLKLLQSLCQRLLCHSRPIITRQHDKNHANRTSKKSQNTELVPSEVKRENNIHTDSQKFMFYDLQHEGWVWGFGWSSSSFKGLFGLG